MHTNACVPLHYIHTPSGTGNSKKNKAHLTSDSSESAYECPRMPVMVRTEPKTSYCLPAMEMHA